jgi:hypothetical protein
VLTVLLLLAAAIAVNAVVRLFLRATASARRRQRVKYDHSWVTNMLGETNTPHEQESEPRER